MKAKKGVVLMSRIHPGESNSSFIMQGSINFLISDNVDAVLLRKKFIFKIIPMINVDGVVAGNYRCSLSGQDLNRNWRDTSYLLFPEVEAIKKLVTTFHS